MSYFKFKLQRMNNGFQYPTSRISASVILNGIICRNQGSFTSYQIIQFCDGWKTECREKIHRPSVRELTLLNRSYTKICPGGIQTFAFKDAVFSHPALWDYSTTDASMDGINIHYMYKDNRSSTMPHPLLVRIAGAFDLPSTNTSPLGQDSWTVAIWLG